MSISAQVRIQHVPLTTLEGMDALVVYRESSFVDRESSAMEDTQLSVALVTMKNWILILVVKQQQT